MCELFAMSSRLPARVTCSLEEFAAHGGWTGPHRDGWGIAYHDGHDARLIRDIDAAADSARVLRKHLGKQERKLFDELAAEFQLTLAGLREVRNREQLLADQTQLQANLALRNPYLDPLSLLQIALLEESRAPRSGGTGLLDAALGSTLNGIAQGLRNTG